MLEADFSAAQRLFINLLEPSKLMGWMTDANGFCVYRSPQWTAFTGQAEKPSSGYGWLQIVHPDDRVAVREAYFKAADHELELGISCRVQRAHACYALVWVHGVPQYNEEGQYIGMIGTITATEEYAESIEGMLSDMAEETMSDRILTARERQVLELIADGSTSEFAAEQLGLATRTIEAHVRNACNKLGATNRVQLIAKAIKAREIDL